MKNFTVRKNIVQHPDFQDAVSAIEEVHTWQRDAAEPSFLALVGPSGSGKTTALKEYQARFPSREELTHRVIPVLYVQVPAAPTIKALAESMLVALGDPMRVRMTNTQVTDKLIRIITGCKVELIFLDEFQHFVEGTRRGRLPEISDWLKVLLNRLNASVVLAGLPILLSVLEINPQLRRRFSRIVRIRSFELENKNAALTFMGVTQALAEDIPMPCPALQDESFLRKLHVATNGLVDYICKLLNGAYRIAHQRGARQLMPIDFQEAFRTYIWDEATPTRDPFDKRFNGFPLIQKHEPFSE